jgi:hypothetical protein
LLAAFPTSGQSAVVFCRAAGLPLATFTVWQRAARQRPPRAGFVRVALATDDPSGASADPRHPGMRAVVRSVAGAAIVLEGLDAATVRGLVALLLADGGGGPA